MKYKAGDKVLVEGKEGVYTVIAADDLAFSPQYRIEDYKHNDKGWYLECQLSPAGNLIDPEEATEQFAKDLDSGKYDRQDVLSQEELDGLMKALDKKPDKSKDDYEPDQATDTPFEEYTDTDAVVKGRERDATDEIAQELVNLDKTRYNYGYADGYAARKDEEVEVVKAYYKQGMDEAWKVANAIMHIDIHERVKLFGVSQNRACFAEISDKFTAQEALEKLKAYEQENKIEVGDIVINNLGVRGIVSHIAIDKVAYAMWEDGSTDRYNKDSLKKTGTHYDIRSILDQLKE